jgi:hypothetical protein
MNQRADSWKKNLRQNKENPMIYLLHWLLSHTVRRSRPENRRNRIQKRFGRLTDAI